MTPTESALLYFAVGLQLLTFLALLFGVARRIATKDDIKRLDDRIDKTNSDMEAGFARIDERFAQQDAKMEARFAEQEAKIEKLRMETDAGFQRVDERFEKQDERAESLRLELKTDLQRVEDRAAEANEYHAKSVALLDGILRQLQERREPL